MFIYMHSSKGNKSSLFAMFGCVRVSANSGTLLKMGCLKKYAQNLLDLKLYIKGPII